MQRCREVLFVRAESGCEWWEANLEDRMARRTLDVGTRSVGTPTAREELGGYARAQWLLLLERERVDGGASNATELPVPSWIALTDPSTTIKVTEIAPSE